MCYVHCPPYTKVGHTHCFDPRHEEPCLQPCQACAEECDPQFLQTIEPQDLPDIPAVESAL